MDRSVIGALGIAEKFRINYNIHMPQEPKKRHSRQRKGKRRASIFLKKPIGVLCVNCGSIILPHMICRNCGFYKGKQVVVLKKDKKKEEK